MQDGLVLTSKQREVLELIADGNSTKHMAKICGISPQAIDRRVEGLLRKSGCDDRRELVRWYRQSLGVRSAAETNIGRSSDVPASATSERIAADLDGAGDHQLCSPTIPITHGPYPEARLVDLRRRVPVEWLGVEVTWLQLIIVLLLVREMYEVLS